MQVYGVVAEDDACPICYEVPEQLCVAVPCGHHVCGSCARQWASRLPRHVRVPEGPAVEAVVGSSSGGGDGGGGGQTVLPPWPVTEPAPVAPPHAMPAAPAAAPSLPAIGGVFEFHGRPVLWVRLWRFGTCIVLVHADTGRLCQDGSWVDPPAAVPDCLVVWHDATQRANRKWTLLAEVHDV